MSAVELMNSIQTGIIERANRDGINLDDSFDGPADFKKWIVGQAVDIIADIFGISKAEAAQLLIDNA